MKQAKIILFAISTLVQLTLQDGGKNDDFYRAAVIEYSPDSSEEKNLEHYIWFIKETKEAGVDIIVFPENALHDAGGYMEGQLSNVPDPEENVIPCRNQDYKTSKVMEKLSCAAQEHTIYVVVNLMERVSCNLSDSDCPMEGRLVYKTDVVLDKRGTVISRYRKYNLRDEKHINKTKELEVKFFDTDFGVRFGLLTSLDIVFPSPALELLTHYNITNFIYPSFWYGELPFLTGLQIQSGWSYSLNVNLLASGVRCPSTGSGGGGIYVGRRGPPIFSMSDRNSSIALIAKVPKNVRTIHDDDYNAYEPTTIVLKNNAEEEKMSYLEFQRDSTLEHYQSMVLREDRSNFNEEICTENDFCCNFQISYSKNYNSAADVLRKKSYKYRAVAYKGKKQFSDENVGMVEACAVILCTGPNLEDCGNRPESLSHYPLRFKKMIISGEFRKNDTILMPNILLGSGTDSSRTKLVLLGAGHYSFHTTDKGDDRMATIELGDETRNFVTFGIYARDFSKGSAHAVKQTFYMLIVALVFVRYF